MARMIKKYSDMLDNGIYDSEEEICNEECISYDDLYEYDNEYSNKNKENKMPIPKVKTGPTMGQERSRNKNGAWRRKRNDTGSVREKGKKLNIFKIITLVISSISNLIIWILNFIKNKKVKNES